MHEQFNQLLQQFIDGRIEPLEQIMLEEHLIYCRTCRKELNQLKLLDWELKNQQEMEVPAELAVLRMDAIKTHLAAERSGEKEFETKDIWRLQLQILRQASGFISINPVNRTLNRTIKGSFSMLGKAAGVTLKKRSPLLGRFIPGQV